MRVCRELLARCRELTAQINGLERERHTLMRRLVSTLLALPGCGVLSAATLFAARAGRFRPEDAYARFTRALTDAENLTEIERVHRDNFSVYGSRKEWAQLRREGG